MMYVIQRTTDNAYVKLENSGRISYTTDISKALRKDEKSINNIFNNNIAPYERKYHIIKNAEFDFSETNLRKINDTIDVDIDDISSVINKMLHITYDELISYKKKLCDELSHIDQEISDIEHYIEFNILNNMQRYEVYTMLHKRFGKRREIKNNLQKFDIFFNSSWQTVSNNSHIEAIVNMENRKYNPRVLEELFERNDV